MPKKSREVTVPMSEELEQMIVEPLEFGDSKSGRIRELVRLGLEADGVNPERIPREDDQRSEETETDGGQVNPAD